MSQLPNKRSSWWLLRVFILLTLGMIGGGALLYRQQTILHRNQIHEELALVSDFKVHQVAAWLQERYSGAVALSANPLLRNYIAAEQKAQGAEKQRIENDLNDFLELYTTSRDYLSAALITPERGKAFWENCSAVDAATVPPPTAQTEALQRVLPTFSHLHRCELEPLPHIDLFIPIPEPGTPAGGAPKNVTAFLLFRLDPAYALFPLIQKWPTASPSAETMLVRCESDRVLYLNELRFKKDTAAKFSEPPGNPRSLSARVISGATGLIEGEDYRGVPVLAYAISVPGTDWKLLSKIDRTEAEAALRVEAQGIALVIGLLNLMVGLLIAFLWYRRESIFRREQAVAELQQAALSEHFNLAMRHANDIILLADENLCLVEANDRAIEAYGYPRAELIGMPSVRLRLPGQEEAFAATTRQVLCDGSMTYETVHCRKDGSTFPVEVSLHAIPIRQHTFYQAIIRDLTVRKRAEAALQAERDQAQRYLDVAGVLIYSLDADANITMINQAGCRILGYEAIADVIGKNWYDTVVPAQSRESRRARFRKVLEAGVVEYTGDPRHVNSIIKRDGEERLINFHDVLLWDKNGRAVGMLCSGHDVTEHIRIEERLEYMNRIYAMMSEINQAVIRTNSRGELFRMVCDSVVRNGKFRLAWIGLLDRDSGRITPVVQAGFSNGYVENLNVSIHSDQPSGQGPVGRAIRDGRCVFINNFEEDSVLAPRRQQAVERGYGGFAVVPLRVGDAPLGILVIYASELNLFGPDEMKLIEEIGTDINFAIAKMEGEESHRQAESSRLQLAMVIEQAAEGVIITDMQGRMTYVNPAFEKMSGYSREEAFGQNPHILKSGKVAPEIYAQMWRNLRAGELWHGELINKRKDGALYQVEATLCPIRNERGETIGYVGTTRDITREKQLEHQFMQAQKMETVGRLAGGVAHDFNNILQVIMGFCSMLLESMSPTDKHRLDVEEIQKAGRRAADLTRQLLAFSRKQVIEFRIIDVNLLVTGMNKMLGRLIGENIRLETKLAGDLKRVKADAGQVEQVLLNLAVNARDAMSEGGMLAIATKNVQLTETDVREDSEAHPGTFVCLTVVDTGHGMTEYVRSHLFEPFFTTKGIGKGTGMGLATVYGIVKQHEGWIEVESEPGKGSAFHVFLPACEDIPEPAGAAAAAEHAAPPRGGKQRILLVEDEPVVRLLAQRLLTGNGYTVFPAAGVKEALDLFQKENRNFDMILSDVVLEDGTGTDLVEQLLSFKPGLPVIMCSGYADDESRQELIQKRGYRFLHKPYRQAELLRMVNEALTRTTPV